MTNLKLVNDPDTLKEQVQALKTLKTTLQRENLHLKTQVATLKKDLTLREEMLEEFIDGGTPVGQVTQHSKEALLSFRLKATIRDLTAILNERDQTIEALKRNMKVSKLEETQKELEVYQEECARLRRLLGESEATIRRFGDQVAKLKEKLRAKRRRKPRRRSIDRAYRSVSPPNEDQINEMETKVHTLVNENHRIQESAR
jgi:regulator of replication initiation timing